MGKARRQNRPQRRAGGPVASARSDASTQRRVLYWILAIAAVAVLVYVNALGQDFVLDDTRLIRDDVRIRSLANVPGFFTSSYWDLEGTQALYRPLVVTTYAVNYAIDGLSTYGYTIVNIALHAGVSVLLFALVRRLGGSLFVAGVAALAFAIHPVHTEAVAGIAGRTELLAALFLLLAMYFHRLVLSRSRPSPGYRVGVLVCFACALLSKESAMTLVLVLPFMDALVPAHAPDGRPIGPRDRILADYVPLMVVGLAYVALRRAVLGGIVIPASSIAPLDNPLVPIVTTPLGDTMGATSGQAIMTAFAVITEYARLLVWPVRLSPDYSFNQIPLVASPLDPRFLAGVALTGLCVFGVVRLWRREPLAAFGLAFLALTFSIVSNIVITIGTICAERLIYLPSAGALIAAAVGVERLGTAVPSRRRLIYAALVVVAAAGATRTWTRNREWKNDASLWAAAVETAPASARVQGEYGRVLMNQAQEEAETGRTSDAERDYAAAQMHFETALKIYPSYSPPMDGLATILSVHQRYDEAAVLFEKAVKVWPSSFVSVTNWAGLLWDRSRRETENASQLRAEGKGAEADALTRHADAGYRQALEKVDKAIAMRPSYPHAHLIRALLLDGYFDKPTDAIEEFEEVLRLMPTHPQRPLIEKELARLRARQSSGTMNQPLR